MAAATAEPYLPESTGAHASPSRTENQEQFDQLLQEHDDESDNLEQRDQIAMIMQSEGFKLSEKNLECPALEQNPIFLKLKQRLLKFFIIAEKYRLNGPTRKQREHVEKTGVDFSTRVQLHKSLKRLLREVVLAKDKKIQMEYLNRVYTWYFQKLESIGLLSQAEKDEEDTFMNPNKIEEAMRIKEENKEAHRQRLLNQELHQEKEKKWYDENQRSIHKEIPPAKDRIADFKRKSFGKLFNPQPFDQRPTSSITSQGVGDMTTQAFSQLEEEERSTYQHPFKNFYTTGEPVMFKTQNRFEGKSNFFHYVPTEDVEEQKVEKVWFENQNKLVTEKRRTEEMKQTVRQWSDARSRLEVDIQRKKEHMYAGSDFENRGFIRSNWKTKNFNPSDNPLLESSSTEEEEEYDEEYYDEVEEEQDQTVDQQKSFIKEDNSKSFINNSQVMNSSMTQGEKQDFSRSAKSANPRARARVSEGNLPQLVDLTKDPQAYGMRPSTAIQVQQLDAIIAHNKGLPKSKQKEKLPLIQGQNIGAHYAIRRIMKKKTPTLEVVTKFTPVGVIDDFVEDNEENNSKYSQLGKVRAVSSGSARNRIEQVRKLQGSLIKAERVSHTIENEEDGTLDNVFVNSSQNYTLSVYNRADQFQRPQTAPQISNWLPKSQKNLPVVPEEDQPAPQVDNRLPNFQPIKGIDVVSRSSTYGYRMEQMTEIESIKDRLAKDLCPQSMQTLIRAILVPEEQEYIPKLFDPKVPEDQKPKKKGKKGKKGKKEDKGKAKAKVEEPPKKEEKDPNAQELRTYPRIIDSLMVNPFPKKKKKGKKKKGKK